MPICLCLALSLPCQHTNQVLHSDVEETLQLLTMRQLAEQGQPVPGSPTAGAAAGAGPSRPAGSTHKQEQQAALAPLAQLLEAAGPEWAGRAAHIRACLEEGGACARCSAVVRVLCVAPCACLLCVDCASSERTACPQCGEPYRMQARRWEGPRRCLVLLCFVCLPSLGLLLIWGTRRLHTGHHPSPTQPAHAIPSSPSACGRPWAAG